MSLKLPNSSLIKDTILMNFCGELATFSIQTSLLRQMLLWAACYWDPNYGPCTMTLHSVLHQMIVESQEFMKGNTEEKRHKCLRSHQI